MVVYTLVYAALSGPAIDLKKMPILAKKIIFSDEDHFDLGGYVTKQNCRIRGTKNPHAYIEKPTHPKRVTAWCGFNNAGKYCDLTLKIVVMLHNVCENCVRILVEEKQLQLRMFVV